MPVEPADTCRPEQVDAPANVRVGMGISTAPGDVRRGQWVGTGETPHANGQPAGGGQVTTREGPDLGWRPAAAHCGRRADEPAPESARGLRQCSPLGPPAVGSPPLPACPLVELVLGHGRQGGRRGVCAKDCLGSGPVLRGRRRSWWRENFLRTRSGADPPSPLSAGRDGVKPYALRRPAMPVASAPLQPPSGNARSSG